MNETHSKQAQQHAQSTGQATFLDQLFETHRVIRMSMCASFTGMVILLALAYLMRETHVVLHLCILAAIMLILCVLLCIYKVMLANDEQNTQEYNRIQQTEEERTKSYQQHHKSEIIEDEDDGSDSSSLVEVIPRKHQSKPNKPERTDVSAKQL